jgi:hypothetical protein
MEPERLNEFERALLTSIARHDAAILAILPDLLVGKREFTGLGGFTYFEQNQILSDLADRVLTLKGSISMPGVPMGRGAVLFLKAGQPAMLETFTYGDEQWNGVWDGFSIQETT